MRIFLGSSLGILCSSTLKFHFTDMKTEAQRWISQGLTVSKCQSGLELEPLAQCLHYSLLTHTHPHKAHPQTHLHSQFGSPTYSATIGVLSPDGISGRDWRNTNFSKDSFGKTFTSSLSTLAFHVLVLF